MVLKTKLCCFSSSKIYPWKNIKFIRLDSQVFLFINSKCKQYVHKKLKASKHTWTTMSIVGATLEVIQKKRTKSLEVRNAARKASLCEIMERIKKMMKRRIRRQRFMSSYNKNRGSSNMSKGEYF
ncbi:hypothetical protein H5410_050984 [Solanum commersonii]|uniref:Large ribosomal subunit protein eL24-related N-terminal domain-containing protein n=1 Tax=Solanum commersonii TaxID=4109 RepID=A0A9J5WYN3_SOLCO|nr:hypothetical protein H5410_050984 [Solanum commersonii]